jgi:CheY-like chemotaxis protein
MDGNEVCRLVATLPFDDKPVMIALSGWGMEEDRNRTREAGFAHHLVKPVAPQALFELLDSMGYAEAKAPLP